jgi:predicted RNase H-like nuclease (RuvC/YqgF family)
VYSKNYIKFKGREIQEELEEEQTKVDLSGDRRSHGVKSSNFMMSCASFLIHRVLVTAG